MNHSLLNRGIVFSILFACGVGELRSQTATWNGATSSDPTVASNWSGSVPTIGGVNTLNLVIMNSSNNQLVYGAANGTTTFNGFFTMGATGLPGGSMTLNGGNLIVNSTSASIIGQDNSATSTITMTAGSLLLSGGGMILGNNRAAAIGIINLSGGTITDAFNAPFTGSDLGLFLGRIGGTGRITLSGSAAFVLSGPGSAAADISFGTSSYINFLSGGTESLSLYNGGSAGASLTNFDSYVSASHILLNGSAATSLEFTVTTVGSQDIYTLAVPEPASLLLMLPGGVALVLLSYRKAPLWSRSSVFACGAIGRK